MRIIVLFLLIPFLSCGQESKTDSNFSSLQIHEENGMFGLITTKGDKAVDFQYRGIEEVCNVFICKTESDFVQLRNLRGEDIIGENLTQIRIMCNGQPVIVGKNIEGEVNIYNHEGEIISPFKFTAIPKVNNYQEGSGKLVLTKIDGDNCLLEEYESSDGSHKLKIIEKPRGHNSARIITYLPAQDGIFYKQVSLNNERFLSDPIYIEICFEPECIMKFKDKINVRATKSILAKAVGIMPDMDIHVFARDGKILNE